ncbi:MAG: TorF family putative porin [Xanthobacteraceae bacterium]|nr:TorF family putative porin [Xanthobacteraceae bacterium]QYK45877.1 MAG: TorF family putative porin [Xanthobacteraceae bacterium]
MKKILGTGVALALLTGAAVAADIPVKAPILKAAPAPVWDVAIGGWIGSDYNFRGISQSDRSPTGGAYFEVQYNGVVGQLYAGVAGSGVDLSGDVGLSDPASEIDFYAGWRNTWGKFSLDVGYWYYWYPQETFNTDFQEVYVKAAYAVTPDLTFGVNLFYTPDLLNQSLFAGTDVDALYTSATLKWVTPWTSGNWGSFISGEVGYWDINFVPGFHLVDPSYTYWNAGFALTYKAITIDFRYHDTDHSTASCAAVLGIPGATNRASQTYCSEAFIVKVSFDTLLSKVK